MKIASSSEEKISFFIKCFYLFTALTFVDFYCCMNMKLRNGFLEEVKEIIENSRERAIRSVDHIRVRMYWELGRKIYEEAQMGSE
jgi:hypothetical protein